MSRPNGSDILTLAEAVAAGASTLADAEARLTTEDDRDELRSLVRALDAVRVHAEATHSGLAQSADPAASLNVTPGPVRRQPVRGRSIRPVAGLLAALAAVLVVGLAVSSIGRPAPAGPGASVSPDASRSAAASPSAAPSPSPAVSPEPASTRSPAASPAPSPASRPVHSAAPSPVAAEGLPPIDSSPLPAPNLAFWTVDGEAIHILLWDPMTSAMTETALVDTWTGDTIERTVLFAPSGALFAVHEINVATSSPVQRLRIFHFDGALWWEAPRLPYVTALAWSADGSALAIGSLPTPWTVVAVGDTTRTGPPEITTFALDDQDGYALIGFSEDAKTLYGFGTGGEAEYWEKLVALDLATGRLARIESIPPGSTALSWANSTAPVDRFHPEGTILIRPGGARGDPSWAIRVEGDGDVPIPVDPQVLLTWGPDRQLVGLGAGVADDGRADLRLDLLDPITGAAAAQPDYAFPAGDYRADLRGAREGYALVTLRPSPSFVGREAVVVELATGRAAVGLPSAALSEGDLRFGGWLGRRD